MKDKNWDDIQRKIAKLGDASTQDYCRKCGESPESGSHIFDHTYEDPRVIMVATQRWSDKAHTQLTKEDVAESFERTRESDRIFRVARTRDVFETLLLFVAFVVTLLILVLLVRAGFNP